MTDQLILTTAQREQIMQALTIPHGNAQSAKEVLQSLPIVQEPQSDAILRDICELEAADESDVYAVQVRTKDLKIVLERYTSPQLTPITADGVTAEMRESYIRAHQNTGMPTLSEQIAAAYNAVIKHRSEEK